MKKVISMNYDCSSSSWKPWRWVKIGLIVTMRDIHINSNLNPLTKLTSSSTSTKFKDIFPWNISQMITKTLPFSTNIVISYAINRASHCKFHRKSMQTEATKWSELPKGGRTIVEQILVSKESKKSKRARLRESQSGMLVRKLTIWVRSFEIERLQRNSPGLSVSSE